MIALRCTRKLLKRLKLPAKLPEPPAPTNALGHWYGNTLNVGRERFILLTSERSLLSVIVPARDLAHLPERLANAVWKQFLALEIDQAIVEREIEAMHEVIYASTASRAVLGAMNLFAIHADDHLYDGILSLDEIAWRLNETPMKPLKFSYPREVARELLTLPHH